MEIQDVETNEYGCTYIHSILIDNNIVLGIAKLCNWEDDNTCVLSDLVVKEEYRGNNYSILLQEHRELLSKNRFGAKKCFLFCDKKRGGLRVLYKKRGYKYHGKHQTENSQIWMVKNLEIRKNKKK